MRRRCTAGSLAPGNTTVRGQIRRGRACIPPAHYYLADGVSEHTLHTPTTPRSGVGARQTGAASAELVIARYIYFARDPGRIRGGLRPSYARPSARLPAGITAPGPRFPQFIHTCLHCATFARQTRRTRVPHGASCK